VRIYVEVDLQGETNYTSHEALVDTGADISLIPLSIARDVGAWNTSQQTNVVGVHGQSRILPIVVANLYFPSLNNVGGEVAFAMSDVEQELIIGMDILRPLGIIVDTKTSQLSIKNEIWEAFKTLATVGVLVWGGIKVIKKLSEKNE
jgi:predicted aspartyl protease